MSHFGFFGAMPCPACRRPMPAECGRAVAAGLVIRARVCPHCGTARLTRERAVSGADLLADRPGFFCRRHHRPLDVECVRRVGPGIVVRYRRCAVCGPRVPLVRSEERDGCSTLLVTATTACQSG